MRSPETTRTPHPAEMPCDADFTIDSSTTQRGRGKILEIEVGIVAARRKSGRQVAFEVMLGQAVVFEEKSLFIIHKI